MYFPADHLVHFIKIVLNLYTSKSISFLLFYISRQQSQENESQQTNHIISGAAIVAEMVVIQALKF